MTFQNYDILAFHGITSESDLKGYFIVWIHFIISYIMHVTVFVMLISDMHAILTFAQHVSYMRCKHAYSNIGITCKLPVMQTCVLF